MKTKLFTLLLAAMSAFTGAFAQNYAGPTILKIADFEDDKDCFTRKNDNIESETIIANPYQEGINTSSKVLEVKFKESHVDYAVLARDYRDGWSFYPIGNTENIAEGKYRYAHFKVWKPILSPIRWIFRNASGGDDGYAPDVTNTQTNGWEYIVMDLFGTGGIVAPDKTFVGFNLNLDKTANGQGITVYLDDIYLSNSPEPITELLDVSNVLTGKPINDFNDILDNYPGTNATDGVLADASRYISAATNNEHMIEIDLEGSYTLNSAAIYRDLSNATQKMPKFEIQINNAANGEEDNWESVLSEENNTTSNLYIRSLEDAVANKVRFYVPAYNDNRVRLIELAIYGKPYIPAGIPTGPFSDPDNDVKQIVPEAKVIYNRAIERFSVNNIAGQMTVSDINGRILMNRIVVAGETIDASRLAKGVYLVHIAGKTTKVIK